MWIAEPSARRRRRAYATLLPGARAQLYGNFDHAILDATIASLERGLTLGGSDCRPQRSAADAPSRGCYHRPMLAPPPDTLHIEGAAHETRIFLDHGCPRSPWVPWKRAALVVWVASFALVWFLPFLLCPVAGVATLLVMLALAGDFGRTDVHRIRLRADHLQILRRGWSGLTSEVVPYTALESVALASEQGGRGRDAVLLRWRRDGVVHSVRIGTGRDPRDLAWLREAFSVLVARHRVDADEELATPAEAAPEASSRTEPSLTS